MPETPADSFNGFGEADASLAIAHGDVWPAFHRLSDMLNPHREMKPVQHMMGWTNARGFTKGTWSFGAIAQDRDRCHGRRPQPVQHAAQLVSLAVRLGWHAAEDGMLPVIVADLGKKYLERTHLITANRAYVTAVDRQRDRSRLRW